METHARGAGPNGLSRKDAWLHSPLLPAGQGRPRREGLPGAQHAFRREGPTTKVLKEIQLPWKEGASPHVLRCLGKRQSGVKSRAVPRGSLHSPVPRQRGGNVCRRHRVAQCKKMRVVYKVRRIRQHCLEGKLGLPKGRIKHVRKNPA